MSRRFGILVMAVAFGGCFMTAADQEAGQDDDDGFTEPRGCFADTECVLAGPSCCECPTFALRADSGWQDACEQVDCPPPADCPALVATCDSLGGSCVATCAPVQCDLECRNGFAVDDAGCTVCACGAGPLTPECDDDTDCVQVPADCCGCERGGADTAVPQSIANTHVQDLMCTGKEACPGVSTCDASAAPRCDDGVCTLTSSGVTPPDDGECGRPDQPPCPDGLVCVINVADAEAGTGRCEAPNP
jgi:hypothetical protein